MSECLLINKSASTSSKIEIPHIGDILTLDIDGNPDHNQWRVMKIDGNEIELLAMCDLLQAEYG